MKIAIIGCGNMGSCFAERLGSYHHLYLHDRDQNWSEELAKKVNGTASLTLSDAVQEADIIILAVKPQNFSELALLLAPLLNTRQIVISLLAGTLLSTLKENFPNSIIVRIMPNLAIKYGEGVVGIVDSPELTEEIKKRINELLSPLGFLFWLKENLIDALTALAGSGPAFILTIIEAMTEAGVVMGLRADDAEALTLEMIHGSVAMMQKGKNHPGEFKRQIASPQGTTIAGLRMLEKNNLRSGLIETLLASYQRAQEIAVEKQGCLFKSGCELKI